MRIRTGIFCILFCCAACTGQVVREYGMEPPRDACLLSGGLLVAGVGEWASHHASPPDRALLDRSRIFMPDQIALNCQWSDAGWLSDITLGILALAPFAILIPENRRAGEWTESVIYLESQLWTVGLTRICKGVVQRPRPCVYQDSSLPLDREAALSFFSGHTSIAFAGAVSTSIFWEQFHPDSEWRSMVWISTLSLAASTGILRILAGKHFPTDVLAGAVVGSLIGWAVPRMHQEPVPPEQIASPGPAVVTIQFSF